MRKAIYKMKVATVIMVSLTMLACQTTNNVGTLKVDDNSYFTNKSTDFKDILKDDDVKCEKEKAFQVKASNIDELMKTAPKESSSNPIDFRDKPFGYYSNPDYGRKYPYRQVNETPKDVREGSISLTFRDEDKIRLESYIENFSKYQKKAIDMTVEERNELEKLSKMKFKVKAESDKKDDSESIPIDEFSSLDKNTDESKEKELNQLNEILKKYKVVSIGLGSGIADGEEEALKDEKTLQRISDSGDHSYDESNTYSNYRITVKDADIYNLVNELRKIEIVRECNYNFGVSVDSYETNEPIFNNNNNLSVAQNTDGVNYINTKTNEDLRYWFARINAYKAWNQMDTYGVSDTSKIANIAVIDLGGFNPNHQDFTSSQIIDTVECQTSCVFNPLSPYKGNTIPIVYPAIGGTSHGTYVSSVATSSLNGIGSIGLAHKSKVLMIHAAGSDSIEKAIKYIRDLNRSTNSNIKVINMSISSDDNDGADYTGALGSKKQPIESVKLIRDEIYKAYDEGVLTVMSASNYNHGIGDPYKADYINSKALVIGGTAKYTNTRWDDYRSLTIGTGGKKYGSNFGSRVDLSAPAEDIVFADQSTNKYAKNSGTFFAAPMVTSAAAMLMSLQTRPDLRNGTGLSVEKVKNLLIYSAAPIQTDRPIGKRNGNVFYSSPNGRLLDMYKAIDLATKMASGNNYARIHNIDSFLLFTHLPSGNNEYGFFKDDKTILLPSSTGSARFATHNSGCTYSMGYQVWKANGDVVDYVKGIAGKWMPLKIEGTEIFSEPVSYDWLNNVNTEIIGMPQPGQAYTINY